MKFKLLLVSVLFIYFLSPGFSLAQNKVVVIPLTETVETPLDPFASVTAESPAYSDYFDNVIGGHITDKVTGLVWQKSDAAGSRTWYEAWDYCQDLELPSGVWRNWRLPSVEELISIVDYGALDPSINFAFWSTNSTPYWTATTDPDSSDRVFIVEFSEGRLENRLKTSTYMVRCVRGLPVRDSLFKNNGNGTVTDLATGLTWQREDDNIIKTWNEANTYCSELSLVGNGWRLPTVKELRSIVDDRVDAPAIDGNVFPGTNTASYWSATTHAGLWDAWYVDFTGGSVNGSIESATYYVRCVR